MRTSKLGWVSECVLPLALSSSSSRARRVPHDAFVGATKCCLRRIAETLCHYLYGQALLSQPLTRQLHSQLSHVTQGRGSNDGLEPVCKDRT